ncbi:hypothetical protein LB572_02975 [Mesorhizobium sp. BH1-1-5]|uniref:hypothetical protein n=1 Tax=Mesorhizobium sp. BH1-1-5 TaxID=2876661 RepID=UPI001CCD3544|nr:hypothetical protein [Mesorhizobium sp. BH1-1-5]MBZ9986055.1 hypothetical protein [Mesorhizobium sp. BH1-1-5]
MSAVFPVNPDARWRSYTAAAAQTVFAIPFPFQDDDDVTILKVALDGTVSTLARPADYDVAGAENPAGGSFTLTAPAAAGEKYMPVGKAVLERVLSIVRGGRYNSAATDEDLDRLMIIAQEQRRDIDRSWKAAYGTAGGAITAGADGELVMFQDGNMVGSGENVSSILGSTASAVAAAATATAQAVIATTQAGIATAAAASVAAAVALIGTALQPDTGKFAQALTGKFWQVDAARIHRMTDRVLIDAAARDFNGNRGENASYVATAPGGSGYLDRAASFASYSSKGGVGGSFATRASDQYTQFPNYGVAGAVPTPWISGANGVLGTRVAYQGRVYDVTVGGVFSGVAPVHTAGAAANGTATLQFVDYTYMVPIALSGFAIQDSADMGTAVWALYLETVSTTAAASYAGEIAVKNKSATNPITSPYSPFSAAMGIGFAGGGDPAAGAPTNPSAHAILIYKNGSTWNTGIVFAADGLTGSDGVAGFGTAIKLARGHVIEWQYAGSNVGFDLVSTVDVATDKQTLSIDSSGARFLNDNSLASFQVAKVSGVLTGYIAAFGSTAGLPVFQTQGSAANVGMGFQTKGTGGFSFVSNYNGTPATQFAVSHTANAVNYVQATGAIAAAAPSLAAAGTDANIGMGYATKGTGVHSFYTNGTAKQFEVAHVANAANYWQLQGSATGQAVTLRAAGTDADIPLVLLSKGAGTIFFRNQGLNTFQVDGPAASVNRLAVIAAVTTGSPLLYTSGTDANISGALQGTGTGGWKFLDGAGAKKVEYNTTGVGFFGVAPVAQQAIGAALSTGGAETNTNIATRINQIRTALINLGLAA